MSYRELRNFTERMKALGYPRLISMENFRTPNFELIADALTWLVQRYDASAELTDDISNEYARVEFLKSVAQIMVVKARVKLNIKRLYKADGYAVKEMLKVCSLLYNAMQTQEQATAGGVEEGKPGSGTTDITLGDKLDELKEAKEMSSQIVDSGAKLYTLLGKEEELKKNRDAALVFLDSISLNLESNDSHKQIERNIREQINIIQDGNNDLGKLCSDLERDQKSLTSKIERKQSELERAEKRFKSLREIRPAFMEEYDMLEGELKVVYEAYLEKFRNLQYLESQLAKYHQAEMEKKKESDRALQRMQKRLREEELRILRGEQEVDENGIDDSVFDSGKSGDDESDEDDDDLDLGNDRGNGKGVGMRSGRPSDMERGREGAQVIGSMDAGDSDDDSDSDSDGGAGRNFSDDDDLGSSDESGLDDDLDDDLDMDEDDDEEEFF